jgi:urease accessory protein
VVKCDLLVINKFDLAPYVGVDIDRMIAEARDVRAGRPVMLTNCRTGEGVDAIVEHLSREVLLAG